MFYQIFCFLAYRPSRSSDEAIHDHATLALRYLVWDRLFCDLAPARRACIGPRPYVVKLLDEGKIPSRTVGKYRRVRFDDLMAYKRKDDEARAKVLDQLTAEAQELGLGY